MNKFIFYLSLISFLSCGINKKEVKISDSQELNEKYECKKEDISFIPDTSINNLLKLSNNISLHAIYQGKDEIEVIDGIRVGLVAIFINKNTTEYLLASHYEGDIKNSFSYFEIGKWQESDLKQYPYYNLEEEYFQTESGIKLGMTLEEITNIKGINYNWEINDQDSILKYEINDYNSSDFLKIYAMPGYFMKYRIKNNVISQISFGFEYP